MWPCDGLVWETFQSANPKGIEAVNYIEISHLYGNRSYFTSGVSQPTFKESSSPSEFVRVLVFNERRPKLLQFLLLLRF